MNQLNSLCERLGNILIGKAHYDEHVCTIEHARKNLNVRIMGLPFHSLNHDFNFELGNENDPVLITAELVLLESEVPYVTNYLSNSGITVSAIHNHWLFDNPKLIYIHCNTIMKPLDFALKIANILKYIG